MSPIIRSPDVGYNPPTRAAAPLSNTGRAYTDAVQGPDQMRQLVFIMAIAFQIERIDGVNEFQHIGWQIRSIVLF
jgi:hypothetical protein